ncbi:MAG TPA: membrane protein insertase YidC, partial [Gemmatimonadaceae bacterium]|nr:membrane protein insertase YidC [Gemmatimonadaceae bacterium]
MDRRTFLALLLTALVIVLTPMLFRAGSARRELPPAGSSAAATGATSTASTATAGSSTASPAPPAAAPVVPAPAPSTAADVAPSAPVRVDTTVLQRPQGAYAFVSPGAAPVSVSLADYRVLRPGRSGEVVLVNPPEADAPASRPAALLNYRVVLGRDTIALDTMALQSTRTADGIRFSSTGTPKISIEYRFGDRPYLTRVQGTVQAAAAAVPAQLLVELPQGLRSEEADTVEDIRHLAYGYKLAREDVKSVAFGKLDSTLIRTDSGPMTWVATHNKYFLIALVAPDSTQPFLALRMRGGHHAGKLQVTGHATAILPLHDGGFSFDLYTGPQSWNAMRAAGHGLENVNPYGGWIPGVQPLATIVMRVLLWMRATFHLGYGWVLILFGVVVRLLLWPLNQSAMRASLKMQRIQPELMELQKRFKGEPEKQREAIMRLYQEHGMSPFSQLTGCLPMLLPMPVLFALYFVFQNTIELRGVSFLWLPDLALKDPTYITPLFMGVSMFVLSWIGMRAAPPNPQTKMMSFMMPAVMTVVFLNFASGLNLYYAVQNVAALPQQWMIARERARSGTSAPVAARAS